MIGQPKYKEGQVVKFAIAGENKEGIIGVVDAYGTFEDESDVSYDILVSDENCFYKHIREDFIV